MAIRLSLAKRPSQVIKYIFDKFYFLLQISDKVLRLRPPVLLPDSLPDHNGGDQHMRPAGDHAHDPAPAERRHGVVQPAAGQHTGCECHACS